MGTLTLLEPPVSDGEREALQHSADALKSALARIQ
jgi:hypothetical protein